jgi:hypothetical protein
VFALTAFVLGRALRRRLAGTAGDPT